MALKGPLLKQSENCKAGEIAMRSTAAAALFITAFLPFSAHGQERAPLEAAELISNFDAKVARGEQIASEIGAMAGRDQLIRTLIIQGFHNEMSAETRRAYIDGTADTFERVDSENTARLREILQTMSWDELSSLSPRSANDAYTIISHSSDLDFQREMLALFEPLAFAGRMPGDRYANLFDDVAQMEGRLQRYATNFDCRDAEFQPNPYEDPEHVDERRAALHMETLAAYAARQREMYGNCPSS
jgi:hypothetical protein